jgi:hypothetical protein
LSLHLPLLSIRTHSPAYAPSLDRERVTLNMCTDAGDPPIAVTAEFAPGFGLDSAQFRLLKVSAYLVGLIDHWCPSSPAPATIGVPLVRTLGASQPSTTTEQDLPAGWQRLVLRASVANCCGAIRTTFIRSRAPAPVSGADLFGGRAAAGADDACESVFFVKDLQGQLGRVDDNTFDHQPRGRKDRGHLSRRRKDDRIDPDL